MNLFADDPLPAAGPVGERGTTGATQTDASLLASAQFSRFAQRLYQARPDVADFVWQRRFRALSRDDIQARLIERFEQMQGVTGGDDDYVRLCAALRLLRNDVFCLLMERDLAALADLDEVTHSMSALAELSVACALELIERSLTLTFGVPLGADGQRLTLGVIGMGKLGGGELNVSSDIDLIFVYEEDGQTASGTRPAISNHDFFTRVGRKLMGALAERTAEGYVFRVDMRLRPNGDSGSLVCSLAMLEEYFYVQGREWERYAWIKARLLPALKPSTPGVAALGTDAAALAAAHARLARQLETLVAPFVYRRYLDFGVIDAIRSLHDQIGQEARRRASLRPELSDDVKLGRGGIREIEFGAQVFQLIRGGQDPALRTRPTLKVLDRAAERGLISRESVGELTAAYVFLRQLEHRLQYADDQQTHAMPVDPDARQRLAGAMRFAYYAALHDTLEEHRAVVEREFDQIFESRAKGDSTSENRPNARIGSPPVNPDAACIWSDALFDVTEPAAGLSDVDQAAERLGYPSEIVQRLRATRMSLRYVQLPSQSRQRFDALVIRAISAASEGQGAKVEPSPPSSAARAASLSRLLDFLERIGGRSAYLALLTEYPAALQRVFDVLGNSQWASNYLIRHPQLLDELLDDDAIDAPFDWNLFIDGLRARLAASGDVEQQMDLLRHAQHAEVFRILLRDLAGRLSVEAIGDRLSELADAVLHVTLETVWRSMPDRPKLEDDLPHFAIVAYGKLGGKELGYASDLDLIFLYDHPSGQDDAGEIYARLARRLVSWLTMATGAGQLYDVDLRLRPNGSSGLLVTPLDAFRAYQLGEGTLANAAWVWEHQAITRARHCAGDARVGQAFEDIRREVIGAVRERATLALQIVSMRERAREGHPNRSGLFDLKHDSGGMVDIEFIVQYLVLLHAATQPALIQNSGNIKLLHVFADLGILSAEEALQVGDAYRFYRALQHRLRLDGVTHARVPEGSVEPQKLAVRALWTRIFGDITPVMLQGSHAARIK